MKKNSLFFLTMILLFVFSCGNETGNKETETVGDDNSVTNNKTEETVSVNNVNSEQNQADEAFSYLKKMQIEKVISIKYDEKTSTIINKKCGDLPQNDPLYISEGPAVDDIQAIKTKLEPSGSDYIIVFSSGPSDDPTFIFFKDGQFNDAAFTISALEIVIPGNGSIYSSGHTNNMYNTRRKFKVENNNFTEVLQSDYYVGLKTKTLKPIVIYESEQLRNVVANLPENYSVEVLLNKRNTDLYLIKTDYGLTGWIKLENQMYGNCAIDKLFYAGD